jgi:uracil-DNA glycosylase
MQLGQNQLFQDLIQGAQACRCCPGMDGRRRVLSDLNGPSDAKIMFVAEAPGRLGGELTGRPLVDDASGRHFSALLAEAGIDRQQIFITNTVLCDPQDAAGRNRKPQRVELDNCRGWLERQIQVLDPIVVVTLGSLALAAMALTDPHSCTLRESVRSAVPWSGRTLVPLYHPSPLARTSRSDAEQAEDYRWLGSYLRDRGALNTRDKAVARYDDPAQALRVGTSI